jgi:hypothetical protein
MRWLCLIVTTTAVAALAAGCGGDAKSAGPAGSPDNPLVAKPQPAATGKDADARTKTAGRNNEAAPPARAGARNGGVAANGGKHSADAPGYEKLVERQTRKPTSRFTPCNLVTTAEASAIVGGPVQAPLEAPQGPTCIYRSSSGKDFVTVAVQAVAFKKVQRQIRHPQQVAISDRTAWCGRYGQPMLYLPLSRNRVLSISAPCDVAKQFASKAVARLSR